MSEIHPFAHPFGPEIPLGISFDPNETNPFSALIVGHFYVTFHNHRGVPVFFIFGVLALFSAIFRVVLVVLI